jgi:putative resolvase
MKAKEVKEILGITQNTINNYIKKGVIRYVKVNPYHYIYNDEDVLNLAGGQTNNRYNVTYARVSLPKQKNDLISQKQRLYDFVLASGLKLEKEFSDVKSGMNFKDRDGFNKLIEEVINNKIDTVFVENKDRLSRFGFELIEKLFHSFGTKIVVISNADNITYEQELTQDLISIIHHFSMKSYSNRRKLNKLKQQLTDNNDAEDID